MPRSVGRDSRRIESTIDMTDHRTNHTLFTIKRDVKAPPSLVFDAWSKKEMKREWFALEDDFDLKVHELDFRVGGNETTDGNQADGTRFLTEAVYQDIVECERIIFTYRIILNEEPISVSLATVEFVAAGRGTQMTYTEQSAFLDGKDTREAREHGMKYLLGRLEDAVLRRSGS